jgi:hypothetical protein
MNKTLTKVFIAVILFKRYEYSLVNSCDINRIRME